MSNVDLRAVLSQFVDKNGLLYFKQKLDAVFATKKEIPTKISQLQNDGDFQTSAQVDAAIVAKGYLTEVPAEYVTDAELAPELAKKVDVVEGKNLSTNDLTNALKANYDAAYAHSQIAHAPANAQANIIESVKVNGVAQAVAGKAVDVKVPTKVSELANDSNYLTEVPSEFITEGELTAKDYQNATQVESAITAKGYQTASQVNTIVDGKGFQTAAQVQVIVNNAQHMKREIVETLPEPSKANELTIYLIDNKKGSYDEYMLINGSMDKVGASDVNLDGYLNTTNFTAVSNSEIDAMFA